MILVEGAVSRDKILGEGEVERKIPRKENEKIVTGNWMRKKGRNEIEKRKKDK